MWTCVVVMQRLTDHQSSSAGDADGEFLGYLYFSAATPLGAHGNPPSRVTFVEMHMKHSGKAQVPRRRFPRSVLLASSRGSSPTRPICYGLVTDILRNKSVTSRACRACPATSPSSLPRAYLIGRPAICCSVVLPVCPCVGVVFKVHDHIARNLLRTSSRGCHEDATRKTCPVQS